MRSFSLALLLVGVAGGRAAADRIAEPAGPTIAIIDVQRTDSSGYLVRATAAFDAVKDKGAELAPCVKGYKLDVKDPVKSVIGVVKLEVARDGSVKRVLDGKAPSALDRCVANVVKTWTYPDLGELIVRAGITAPVRRAPKLSTKYVEALQAVCDAVGSDMQDTVDRVRKALADHPDANVERFVRLLGGRWPSERGVLFDAVLANAGLSSCKLREQNP